jgi:PAS domain S-box-containing protein
VLLARDAIQQGVSLDRPQSTRDLEIERLVHDLEVHRVELELQNEELRASRDAAESALARYTEIFDAAPIGYAMLSPDRTIREINLAGARLFARARTALVGRRFDAFLATRSLAAFNELIGGATDEPTHAELELVRDEDELPVRVTVAWVRRAVPAILLAFEDISERREREIELARTEHALRDASRRKDEFLAMLSHELRNPLSPIRTSVSVLQIAPPGSDDANTAIETIDRASSHLTRLVDDLLDVSRIARGRIELQCERVELNELVKEIATDHGPQLTARGIAFELRCADGELWVDGDRARLVQITTNLLANAMKFTPAGGQVILATDRRDCLAVLRVEDSGAGIAPEILERVFEPFVQGTQTIDRGAGGLGLGLALARSLVVLHGGRVQLRSEGVGRGTQVEVELPLTAPIDRDDRDHTAVPSARPRRVLIVEDKPELAESLRIALVLRGHLVRVAHDGRAALVQAHEFRPEVVLCDIGLPDIDGNEVARRLRADPDLCGIYLVALTGYAAPDDVARAKAAGFARHLAKPARLDEIEAMLATVP